MPAPRTPGEMLQILFATIESNTGRSFPAWVELARGMGIGTHKALTDALKAAHPLNHNEAQWVAWGLLDPDRLTAYDRPDDLVEELYSGKRAALRPLYEALMEAGRALGPEVREVVCKTYTSLARGTQFAIVVPRNQSSVDLELVLPEGAAGGRLEPIRSSNPKFRHRIRLRVGDEVDGEVRAALRAAWDHVGG
jgi:hypothetical protein